MGLVFTSADGSELLLKMFALFVAILGTIFLSVRLLRSARTDKTPARAQERGASVLIVLLALGLYALTSDLLWSLLAGFGALLVNRGYASRQADGMTKLVVGLVVLLASAGMVLIPFVRAP